jgi:hypothetical protein
MDIKYLTDARFRVWGEVGTKRRFLQWMHPDLNPPVTFLLEEGAISDLLQALQIELPPEARTTTNQVH